MDGKLIAIESKTSSSDGVQQDLCDLRWLTDSPKVQNSRLRVTHAQLEDRSRRDNPLFYGMTDSLSETWNQTEEKLKTLVSATLNLHIPTDIIERAYTLGAFADKKCRPVLLKFLSFKLKQQIFVFKRKAVKQRHQCERRLLYLYASGSKKTSRICQNAEFCFKLRYNELYVNSKCQGYNNVDDTVFELATHSGSQPQSQRPDNENESIQASASR